MDTDDEDVDVDAYLDGCLSTKGWSGEESFDPITPGKLT